MGIRHTRDPLQSLQEPREVRHSFHFILEETESDTLGPFCKVAQLEFKVESTRLEAGILHGGVPRGSTAGGAQDAKRCSSW